MSADPHFSSDDRSSCSEEYQLGLNAFYEVDEPCDLIRWPRTLSPPVEFVVLESEQKKFQIQNFPTLKCSHFIEHASLEWNIRHAASSNVIAELQNPIQPGSVVRIKLSFLTQQYPYVPPAIHVLNQSFMSSGEIASPCPDLASHIFPDQSCFRSASDLDNVFCKIFKHLFPSSIKSDSNVASVAVAADSNVASVAVAADSNVANADVADSSFEPALLRLFTSSDLDQSIQFARDARMLFARATQFSMTEFRMVSLLNFIETMLKCYNAQVDSQPTATSPKPCTLLVPVFSFHGNVFDDVVRCIQKSHNEEAGIQFQVFKTFDLNLYFSLFRSYPNSLFVEVMSCLLPGDAFSVCEFFDRCLVELESLNKKNWDTFFYFFIPLTIARLVPCDGSMLHGDLAKFCDDFFTKLQNSSSHLNRLSCALEWEKSKISLPSPEAGQKKSKNPQFVPSSNAPNSFLPENDYRMTDAYIEPQNLTWLFDHDIQLHFRYMCLPEYLLIISVEAGPNSRLLLADSSHCADAFSAYLHSIQGKLPFPMLGPKSHEIFWQKVLVESERTFSRDSAEVNDESMFVSLPPEQLTPETTSFTPENVLDVKSLVCSFPSRADDIFWLHTRPFYPFDDSQSSAAERSMATGGDGDHIMPRSKFSFFLQDAKSINYFLQAGFPAFRAYVDDRVCHALQEGVPHRLAKMIVKVALRSVASPKSVSMHRVFSELDRLCLGEAVRDDAAFAVSYAISVLGCPGIQYVIQYDETGEVKSFCIPELELFGLCSDFLPEWKSFQSQHASTWKKQSMFSKLMKFTSSKVFEVFIHEASHKVNIANAIKAYARVLATGAFDENSLSNVNQAFDDFYPTASVSLQQLLLALRTFVSCTHIALKSSSSSSCPETASFLGVHQIRVPRWCLDVLFGPVVCTQAIIEAGHVDATVSIGWQKFLNQAVTPLFPALQTTTQYPEIESSLVLRLLYRMIDSLKSQSAPSLETDLVKPFFSEEVPWTAIAVAMRELRCSSVIECRGTSIALKTTMHLKETFWKEHAVTNFGHQFECAVVFVPDESIFSIQEMIPISSFTRIWPNKESTFIYFENLIDGLAAATGSNFISVAHALQECRGSVVEAIAMLLDYRTISVVKQPGQCDLKVTGDDCVRSSSIHVLKCPHCDFSICMSCLWFLCDPSVRLPPGNLTDRFESTQKPETDVEQESVTDFQALYCCPNPNCSMLLPPPFWESMISTAIHDDQRSSKKMLMARSISRHARHIGNPFANTCMITCTRPNCGRVLALSSRYEMVICSCGQTNSRSFLTTKEIISTDKLRSEISAGACEYVTAGDAVEIKPSAFSEVLRKHRPDMVASYEKANADWNQKPANSARKRFCQTDEGDRFALDFLGLPHFERRANTMRYPCCPPETFTLHDGQKFIQESLVLFAKPDPSYYSYPDNVFISAELLDPILAANLATYEPMGGRDAPKAAYENLPPEIREKISAENYAHTVVPKGSRIHNGRDFGAMRMCPKCYLPKFERECGHLSSHHGEVTRAGAIIDNSCPGCGWFASQILDMPLFDSRLHDRTYGQRKGFILLPVIEAVSRLQECIKRLPEILVESAVPAMVSSISPDLLRFVLSSMITTLNRYALFLDMTQTQQKKQTVSDSDIKIMKDMVKYLNPASLEFQRLLRMAPALLQVPSNHLNLFDHHGMAVAGDIFNQIFCVSIIFYVASKNLTVVHLHDVLKPYSPARSLLAAILHRDLSAVRMRVQNHEISLPYPADGFNLDGFKHSSKHYAMLFFRNCLDYSVLRQICARNGLSSINEVVFAFSRYLDIPTMHSVASNAARLEIVQDFFVWFQASAIRQIRIPSREDVHAWTNERLQHGAGAPADKQHSPPHLQRGHDQRGEDQDGLVVQHYEEDGNGYPGRHRGRYLYANDEIDDAPPRYLMNWDDGELDGELDNDVFLRRRFAERVAGGGRAGGGDGGRQWWH